MFRLATKYAANSVSPPVCPDCHSNITDNAVHGDSVFNLSQFDSETSQFDLAVDSPQGTSDHNCPAILPGLPSGRVVPVHPFQDDLSLQISPELTPTDGDISGRPPHRQL